LGEGGCHLYPDIFIPLRQTLFLETGSSHPEPIRGQKLLDRKRLVSWGIIMVENQIVGSKFRAFSHAQLHITPSLFPHNKLGWLIGLLK